MPAPTFNLPVLGSAPNQYATEEGLENAVNASLVAVWNDVIANGGKIFATRAQAVEAGQAAIPAALVRIVTIEGTALVVRGLGASADDPLFATYPYWGAVLRLDTASEAAARIAADNAVGFISLVNAAAAAPAGGSTIVSAELSAAAAANGIAAGAGSVVRLIMPAGAEGMLRLQIAGDSDRPIMRERNNASLLASDVSIGAALVLERRGGNWVLISGAVGTDQHRLEQSDRAAQDALRSVAIGANADLRTINLGGVGDEWTADLSSTVTNAGVTTISTSTTIEIHPTRTNTTSEIYLTVAGMRYQMLDPDGAELPPGYFVVGRRYVLRRRNTVLRVVSGDVTATDIAVLTADKVSNDNPVNTDAGFQVMDLGSKVTFLHDAEDSPEQAPLDQSLGLLVARGERPGPC
ncbi:hypothetical protein SAMN04488021_13047 [Paracoccus aminovorans]|uniref:Uncharacterized protein n=1 Tax=Paracoccus aminovorans TaxID=34004 RepID=A0A1I3CFI3_9RHOB|nr:hypothetical protein [Paracoccus aminovorans]CQR85271.1 hypothetical protein JCM7685_0690 [Paracoccus aminovorans]SFH73310.1 hypothetical protein SAMN04488021_13047 [Paracoccus aminovorans]